MAKLLYFGIKCGIGDTAGDGLSPWPRQAPAEAAPAVGEAPSGQATPGSGGAPYSAAFAGFPLHSGKIALHARMVFVLVTSFRVSIVTVQSSYEKYGRS
jgi:hypothetical protein